MNSHPQRQDEEHLRILFASAGEPGMGNATDLLGRIVTAAAQQRRRSAARSIVGVAGSTVAVVVALIAAPALMSNIRQVSTPAGSGHLAQTSPTALATTTGPTGLLTILPTPFVPDPTNVDAGPTMSSPSATATVPPADPYAALVALIPDLPSLGSGLTWSVEPSRSSVGPPPVLAFQACDENDGAKQIGPTLYARAERPVTTAFASAWSSGEWPSVDVGLTAWTPGQGSTALQQIRDNTGRCIWIGSSTKTSWSGHDGLLVTSNEVLSGTWHQAATIQLVGDITVNVTVTDRSTDAALERTQALGEQLAAAVRASGIGQG